MRKSCSTCDLHPQGSNACVVDIVTKRREHETGQAVVWCGPVERGEIDPVTLAFVQGAPEEGSPPDPVDLARGLIDRHTCGGTSVHPEVRKMADFLEEAKRRRPR